MKDIIKYQSDSGKVYDTKEEAMQADIAYWRALGQKWLDHLKAEEDRARRNPDPNTSYSRGHQ